VCGLVAADERVPWLDDGIFMCAALPRNASNQMCPQRLSERPRLRVGPVQDRDVRRSGLATFAVVRPVAVERVERGAAEQLAGGGGDP
jgi:hypothetical protein